MPNTSHLYSLRRGLGLWQLTFGGRSTVLKHEQGILYVAYLLYHPPLEPIHALDLVARVQGFNSAFGGTLVPTSSGALIVPDKCARLQERSPALDEMETLRALRRKEQELEALLDDQEASEPLKAEALAGIGGDRKLSTPKLATQRRHRPQNRPCRAHGAGPISPTFNRCHRHRRPASPHPACFCRTSRPALVATPLSAMRGVLPPARGGAAGCFTYERQPA